MTYRRLLAVLVSGVCLVGCVSPDGTPNRAGTGAIIGGVTGAVLGAQVDDDDGNNRDGILIGAAAGATAGAMIGRRMDQQQREFEEELAAERRRNEVAVQRLEDDLLKVTFENDVTFEVDSAALQPGFRSSLDTVSEILAKYGSDIRVVGHTDSTGTESYNQSLSERRAQTVLNYLVDHGVPSRQLEAVGRGELEPVATNLTVEGRAMNRRVELLISGAEVAAN